MRKQTNLKFILKPSLVLTAILLLTLCNSCFRRFTMSRKEINTFYQTHQPKPTFHFLETAKGKLFYASVNEEKTNLPLILFIHGAPGAWYGYIHYLCDSTLVSKYRMISIDRPGFHYSQAKRAVVSIEEQAKLIAPILEKYSQGNCLIVGRSYGAPIAAKLAILHPDKVSALLFVSSAVNPKVEKFWWFSKPLYYPPIRWLMPRMINRASDEKFAHKKELIKLEGEYKQIAQPSIILQGGKDFIIDPRNGSYLDSVLTESPHRYVVLNENGHLITNENKPYVMGCIDLLIQKNDSLKRNKR